MGAQDHKQRDRCPASEHRQPIERAPEFLLRTTRNAVN